MIYDKRQEPIVLTIFGIVSIPNTYINDLIIPFTKDIFFSFSKNHIYSLKKYDNHLFI